VTVRKYLALFCVWGILLVLTPRANSEESRIISEKDASARCQALLSSDFTHVEDAPTRVIETRDVQARGVFSGYCEIRGFTVPQVEFEIRLPTSRWNGKFLHAGCGGMCGQLLSQACEMPLKRGYACLVSTMGHRGYGGDGALWAYNNLQAEVDFAYRATHVSTLAGKAIAQRFYNQQLKRSYFVGCSQGGRQALVSTQRFPWDFDGVIANSPAIRLVSIPISLLHYHLWATVQEKSGHAVLPPAAIQLIHEKAVAKCDLDDGVADGIISNPLACKFRPSDLACKAGSKATECITPLQAEAARRIYAGATTSTGEELYPGPAIGSELGWIGTLDRMHRGFDVLPEMDFLRYMGFVPDLGPNWQPSDYNIDHDYKRLGMMESLLQAENPDLRRFRSTGGKLIVVQGWNDQVTVPGTIIDYYNTVERTMGGRTATQDFFRLFMFPSVEHCGVSEEGPDAVDLLSYLEAWVEHDHAPERVEWTHTPLDRAKLRFTRPVYPYPRRAMYIGSGIPEDAANFRPVEP